MTTIDITKLKRIITQCGSQDEMEMVRAIWNAAQAEEREECARMLRADALAIRISPFGWRDASQGIAYCSCCAECDGE